MLAHVKCGNHRNQLRGQGMTMTLICFRGHGILPTGHVPEVKLRAFFGRDHVTSYNQFRTYHLILSNMTAWKITEWRFCMVLFGTSLISMVHFPESHVWFRRVSVKIKNHKKNRRNATENAWSSPPNTKPRRPETINTLTVALQYTDMAKHSVCTMPFFENASSTTSSCQFFF